MMQCIADTKTLKTRSLFSLVKTRRIRFVTKQKGRCLIHTVALVLERVTKCPLGSISLITMLDSDSSPTSARRRFRPLPGTADEPGVRVGGEVGGVFLDLFKKIDR